MVQPERGFRFGVDSIILAHSVRSVDILRVAELGAGSGIVSFILASHGIGREFWLFEKDEIMLDCLDLGISLNDGNSGLFKVVPGDLSGLKAADFPQMDLVIFNPPYYPNGRGHGRVGDPRLFLNFASGLITTDGLISYVITIRELDRVVTQERRLQLRPVALFDVVNPQNRVFCQIRILSKAFVGVPYEGIIKSDNLGECGAWWVAGGYML